MISVGSAIIGSTQHLHAKRDTEALKLLERPDVPLAVMLVCEQAAREDLLFVASIHQLPFVWITRPNADLRMAARSVGFVPSAVDNGDLFWPPPSDGTLQIDMTSNELYVYTKDGPRLVTAEDEP